MKTVLVDIDDTILDFKLCAKDSILNAAREYNVPFTEDMLQYYFNVNQMLWNQYERGIITKLNIFERRFDMLFKTFNIHIDGSEFEEKFQKYFKSAYIFVEGAEDFIKYLSSKYDIYAASNSVYESQISRLKNAGILGYFKDIFVSDKAGAQKPSEEFFEYCFKHIPDFNKEETIIIGDSLSSDIKGANNAGIKCCWFNFDNKPADSTLKCDYQINCLEEIKSIL